MSTKLIYRISLLLSLLLLTSCNTNASKTLLLIETSYGNIKIELYDDTPEHRDNFIKLVKDGFYDDLLFHRVINDFMIQGGDPESKNAQPGKMLGTGGPGYTIPAEILPQHFHKKGALAAARQGDQTNPERRSSGSQFYLVQGKVYNEYELTTDMQLLSSYFMQFMNKPENLNLKAQAIALQQQRRMNELTNLLISYRDTLETINDVSFTKDFPEDRVKAYTTIGGTPHLDDQYTVFGEVIEGLDVIDKIAAVKTDRNSRPLEDVKFTISIIK